jgi:predicted enzyme related to lactoylglutathione lyase
MPVRESYEEGTPSWVDLLTTDVDGSKTFYSGVFGWDWEQTETDEPGNHYHIARLNGHIAAGLMRQHQEQIDMGLPPLWNLYIAVDDIDATMSKVEPSGGSVLVPAFDVMDDGRMAVIADPTGAVVGFWQAGNRIGAEIVNDPGAFCWSDLVTPDQKAAVEFFGKVVGLKHEFFENPQLGEIAFLKVGEDGVASTMPPPMECIAAHWDIYFPVVDADASAAKIKELGGSIMVEPFDTGHGRLATASDPAGGIFSIIALSEPPTG